MAFYKYLSPFYLGFVVIAILFMVLVWWQRLLPDDAYDPLQMEANFQHSQVARPTDFSFTMYDWDLYAYAGYTYITTGNISGVNYEHPPLGKYLYGLSIRWFGHQNYIQLVYGFLVLTMVYLLGWELFGAGKTAALSRMIYSLLPVGLLVFDKLFWYQLQYSMLDLPLVLLFLLFIYAVISKIKFQLVGLGVILGAAAGVKFMVPAVVLFGSYLVFLLFQKKGRVVSSPWSVAVVAVSVYLLIYLPLFVNEGVDGFFKIHLLALKQHLSHVPEYPAFVPLKVMLFNQWPVWWDAAEPVQAVSQWSWLWPMVAVVIIINLLLWLAMMMQKKTVEPVYCFLVIFISCYFMFINTRLFFPSYLLPILPFGYVLVVWNVYSILKK